jgi:hypothetical protein
MNNSISCPAEGSWKLASHCGRKRRSSFETEQFGADIVDAAWQQSTQGHASQQASEHSTAQHSTAQHSQPSPAQPSTAQDTKDAIHARTHAHARARARTHARGDARTHARMHARREHNERDSTLARAASTHARTHACKARERSKRAQTQSTGHADGSPAASGTSAVPPQHPRIYLSMCMQILMRVSAWVMKSDSAPAPCSTQGSG